MRELSQLGLREHRPIWLQVLAVVCVLVVCVMSTAQVSHTHAEFSALKQGSHHNGPSPDDHCPLCVAMHSALATPDYFAPEPMLAIQRLDSVAAEAARIFRWRFEMASRPPPVQNHA
ncbi:hypothetical protein [Edaphobacter modestus]|uniref:DUF2946 family protein n=1 Tax=Edaphobacter modestus TaxID=388466 RepID=A0A4Q7YVB3_9BACT|nr:hypothetical protein [Edaphobacter modestus]RZU40929.1 hypothetical protein BDD14_2418 [Edaphobacter modestus]